MSSPSQPSSPPSSPEPRHRRDKKRSSAHHECGHSMSPSTCDRRRREKWRCLLSPSPTPSTRESYKHCWSRSRGRDCPSDSSWGAHPDLLFVCHATCTCNLCNAYSEHLALASFRRSEDFLDACLDLADSLACTLGHRPIGSLERWLRDADELNERLHEENEVLKAQLASLGASQQPPPQPLGAGPSSCPGATPTDTFVGGGFGALCPKEYQRLIGVTDLIPRTLQSRGNFPSQLSLRLPMSQYILKATSTWMSNPNSPLLLRGLPPSRRPSTMLRDICSKALPGRNDPAKRLSSDGQTTTTGKYKPYSFSTSICYMHASTERHNTSSGTLTLRFPYPFLL